MRLEVLGGDIDRCDDVMDSKSSVKEPRSK